MPPIHFSHQGGFQKLLGEKTNPESARALILQAGEEYGRLLENGCAPSEPELHLLYCNRILPVLALYQSLCQSGLEKENAFQLTRDIFLQSYFFRLRQGIQWFCHLVRDPFPLIRPALRRMAVSPVNFGSCKVMEDTNRCFAVNVSRCYIADVAASVGLPEAAGVFCASDDYLSNSMLGIRWQRTQTLAQGNSMCDFRWSRD